MSSMKLGAVEAILYVGTLIKFYPYFPGVLSGLVEIQYKRFAHNAAEYYEFHENRRRASLAFVVGVN
jgi:hypothetical protein